MEPGELTEYAEALEDAYVCDAPAPEFLRIMSSHPLLAQRVMVMLARQNTRLAQQLERQRLHTTQSRLAEALLELAEASGGRLPARVTHAALADIVCTTRETVTRTLSQFVQLGLVEVGYRRLSIRDVEGLRRVARGRSQEQAP